jgi:mannose-6-phosphate isomerase-like protein (cupin superfamily)
MTAFGTKHLPVDPDDIAPDGSEVRVLLRLDSGSMAHFQLGSGETSIPVAHKTIEEIWYFLAGRGEMWRKLGDQQEVVPVETGVCITIPVGTHFQFRTLGDAPLEAVGVTMPPWPGEGEAYTVKGHPDWLPTVAPT